MRSRTKFLMTFLFIAALASPSWAAITPDSLTGTVFGGGYVFDGKEHLKAAPVGGLKVGYDFTKRFGLELDIEGLRTQSKNDYQDRMGDDKLNVVGLRLDSLVYFMPDKDLVPYLTFGVGIEHYSSHEGDYYHYNSLVNYGIGAKYFITERLALRGEVRHIIIIEPDFRYRTNDAKAIDDNYVNNGEAIIGLTYVFGDAKPTTPCPPPVVEAPKPAPAPEPAPVVEVKVTKPEPVQTEMEREIIEKGKATLDVKFETDKSNVRPQFHDELAKFADVMKKHPDLAFELAGHTDNVGTAKYNQKLSQRRVDSVKRYIVKNFNIPGERIRTKGYGLTRPIASNTTAAGRQKNRRVEAVVDYTYTVKTKIKQ